MNVPSLALALRSVYCCLLKLFASLTNNQSHAIPFAVSLLEYWLKCIRDPFAILNSRGDDNTSMSP